MAETTNMKLDNYLMECNKTKIYISLPQASLNNAQNKRLRREQERKEREQLLSRRFGPGSDHTAITVDYLGQEQLSLQNSHRNVDEMLHTGLCKFFTTF